MKLFIKFILIIQIIIIPSNIFANDIPIETQTYINQIEEKNKLFKETVNNFGASSKEKAVELYSEGLKNRNGPLQYSVMCKALKIKFKKEMESNKNYAWVTGTSSPWISEYKIYKYKRINKNKYSVIVKFTLNDAKGMIGEDSIELEIIKDNDIWCISRIEKV
ncbi:MAG: hypothetical protein ACRDB0_02585 [Paraclostridium sp.]